MPTLKKQPEPFHTVREIAEAYAVSERTVRRWITAGQLRARRFGRTIRISQSDLKAFSALRYAVFGNRTGADSKRGKGS